jgi:hypothetical protein
MVATLFFIQGTLECDKKKRRGIFVTPIETITTSGYNHVDRKLEIITN